MITLEVHEFAERFIEMVELSVEEGKTIEITYNGKVIAHFVPVSGPKQLVKRDTSDAWKNLERLSAELSVRWPKNVSAIDAVRDVRRDL